MIQSGCVMDFYNYQNQMGREEDEQYNNAKELKKNHSFISPKKRQKLIDLVMLEHMTIYRAAKRLKICHPTAKFILKSHRKAAGGPACHQTSSTSPQLKPSHCPSRTPSDIQKEREPVHLETSPVNTITSPINCSFEQASYLPQMWSLIPNNYVYPPFYYYL